MTACEGGGAGGGGEAFAGARWRGGINAAPDFLVLHFFHAAWRASCSTVAPFLGRC